MKRWPLDKDTFCQLCGVQEESENIFGSAPSFEPPTSWRDWKRFVHIWKGPNRPYVVDIICFHLRARRARIKQRRFRHQGSCIAVAVDRQNIIGWDRAYQGMCANGCMKYRTNITYSLGVREMVNGGWSPSFANYLIFLGTCGFAIKKLTANIRKELEEEVNTKSCTVSSAAFNWFQGFFYFLKKKKWRILIDGSAI